MKRFYMTAAALALMSSAALAQSTNTTTQPADPEQAARKGTINEPSGAGGTTQTTVPNNPMHQQDATDAQKKGTIMEPNAPNK